MEYKTKHGRIIIEQSSDSPVTRARIKKEELVIRYSSSASEDRKDEIYDTIIAVEAKYDRHNPTVRIKILDTDDLKTIQCELGNTEQQTKIVMCQGIDF